MDRVRCEPSASSETPVPANSDPSAELSQLRAVSNEFETLGKEKIRGAETTGYRSKIDIRRLAAYLRDEGSAKVAQQYERLAETTPTTTEVETWIDGKGLIRRMKMMVDSRDRSSGDRAMTVMTANFFDFGISPKIQLPNPSTVYDVTPIIRAKLGLNGSS